MQATGETHWLPDLCRAEALLWVLLLSVFTALVVELLVFGSNLGWVSFGQRVLLTLWMALVGCAISCQVRRVSSGWRPLTCSLAVIFAVQVASALASFAQTYVVAQGLFDVLVANQMLSLLVTAVALRLLFLRSRERLQSELLQQAQFEILQARIQPHFLFNTLNSVASLVATRPADAETAVLNLSDLMRTSLNANTQFCSLEEEWRVCEKYLQIEKLRMEHRLEWSYQQADNLPALRLPSLTLQPLVENAVLHGVGQIPQGGLIRVEVSATPKAVRIEIRNPLPQTPDSSHSGNDTALANVRSRLRATFTEQLSFQAEQCEGEFVVGIEIALPTLQGNP